MRCRCVKQETDQVGRNRRAKRQRRTQYRRLLVLPILDEADPDSLVSPAIEHEPLEVAYCPRCTSVLGCRSPTRRQG